MERTTRRTAIPLLSVSFSVLLLGALGSTWLDEPLVVRPVVSAVEAMLGAASNEEPAEETDAPIVLRAPEAPPAHGGPIAPPRDDLAPPMVIAYQFMAPVYKKTSLSSSIIGRVRRGTTLSLPQPIGKSCKGGTWHRLEAGGYVCTGDGFFVRSSEPFAVDQKLPALDRNSPYTYAQVTRPGAPRFYEIPSAEDLAAIDRGWNDSEGPPSLSSIERYMDGDYFVAIDRRESHETGSFVRTVRGRWVHEGDVEVVEPSKLVGEMLGPESLPMAFVPAGDSPHLFRVEEEGVAEVGVAEPYARATIVEERDIGGVGYVVFEGGLALRRSDVRVAARIGAPKVAGQSRWIHVDLDEQMLVAYEGDEPRYATLVASGKPGWDTPTGLHRVANKFAVTTMKGDDPREGYYEVEDVPWTMFYDGGYALHGAYWHDAFGNVRSHGCTNLSPADARWVYMFTDPEVPEAWQAKLHAKGSWVYLTRR